MRRLALAATLLIALVACADELSTPGEPLRLLSVALPTAYEGEPYDAVLRPTGGVRPFRFEVVEGALPPGMRVEGGRIVGTPDAQGRFAFTVEVRDASLNRTVQRLELTVGPLPEPRISIDVPATDVQRATPLRVRFDRGRGWLGAEIELRWDPERFDLDADGVRVASRDVIAVWEHGPGRLRVDVAALGGPRDVATDLVALSLVPRGPQRIGLDLVAVSTTRADSTTQRERVGAPATSDAEGEP